MKSESEIMIEAELFPFGHSQAGGPPILTFSGKVKVGADVSLSVGDIIRVHGERVRIERKKAGDVFRVKGYITRSPQILFRRMESGWVFNSIAGKHYHIGNPDPALRG